MKPGQLGLIAILVSGLIVTGCANTIRGIGRDTANTVNATQDAGKKIVHAAN